MKRGIAEVLGDDPQGVYAPEMSQLVEALLAKSNSFVEQRMLQTFIQSLPQVEKCAFLEKLVKSVVEEEREPVWNLTKQFQQTLGKVSLQKALSALSFLNELGSALSELWHKSVQISWQILICIRECLLLLFLLSAVKDAKKGGTKFLQEAKFSPLQLLLFFDVVVCQVAGIFNVETENNRNSAQTTQIGNDDDREPWTPTYHDIARSSIPYSL